MEEKHSEYFEGILQIRHGNQELIDWILKKVQEDGKAKVTKAKKVRNGVDLYVTDQHYLQSLGKKIKQNFIGIYKVSTRLHTTDKMTSKLLYRISVLFKPLNVKRGEIIKIEGEEAEILGVDKRARIRLLRTGQKKEISLDKLEKAIKYAPKIKNKI